MLQGHGHDFSKSSCVQHHIKQVLTKATGRVKIQNHLSPPTRIQILHIYIGHFCTESIACKMGELFSFFLTVQLNMDSL